MAKTVGEEKLVVDVRELFKKISANRSGWDNLQKDISLKSGTKYSQMKVRF